MSIHRFISAFIISSAVLAATAAFASEGDNEPNSRVRTEAKITPWDDSRRIFVSVDTRFGGSIGQDSEALPVSLTGIRFGLVFSGLELGLGVQGGAVMHSYSSEPIGAVRLSGGYRAPLGRHMYLPVRLSAGALFGERFVSPITGVTVGWGIPLAPAIDLELELLSVEVIAAEQPTVLITPGFRFEFSGVLTRSPRTR